MIDLRGKGNQRRAATAIRMCMMDGKELPDLLLARWDSRRTHHGHHASRALLVKAGQNGSVCSRLLRF